LISANVSEAAMDAYRSLRQIQHRARLDETPTQVSIEDAAGYRDAILALWNTVFETP